MQIPLVHAGTPQFTRRLEGQKRVSCAHSRCSPTNRITQAQSTIQYLNLNLRVKSSSSDAIPAPGAEEGRSVSEERGKEVVDEALKKVQEAIVKAERTVETIESLPSARLPTMLDKVKKALGPVSKLAFLLLYCRTIHSLNSSTIQVIGGSILAFLVAIRGYRKSSLSPSGSIAAIVVGAATLGSSFRAGLVLLAFFFASSALTKLGDENKDVEEDHKKGGQRNWVQVLSNGGIPALLSLAAASLSHGMDWALIPVASNPTYSLLSAAFLGYYACCCGDTWSSELGQLSEEEPRLITTLRPVRKGTNGGVTLLGLAASCLGGLFIGLVFYVTTIVSPAGTIRDLTVQARVIPLSICAGLVGSLIDSVLGATIQFTGYNRKTGKITGRSGPDVSRISGISLLDNNGVNVLSASLTACLTSAAAMILL